MRALNRRTFLAGTGAVVLAACGSKQGDRATPGASAAAGSSDLEGAQVLGRWNNVVLVPGPTRLPVSFGRDQTILTDGPDQVTGRILDGVDDSLVVDGLTGVKHNTGIPNAYWLFTADVDEAGLLPSRRRRRRPGGGGAPDQRSRPGADPEGR